MNHDNSKNFQSLLADLQGQARPEIESADYVVSPELYGAVEAALATGQPLLLTGEPGTGKTRLAAKLAHDFSTSDPNFDSTLEIFNTKTTSTAQDLFYTYDALRHFNDANISKAKEEKAPDARAYIRLEALGRAIGMTGRQKLAWQLLQPPADKQNGKMSMGEPRSKVVLIDEIDKAPRDFTNDILNEIENMQFEIKELQDVEPIKKGDQRIVVIMTSNSEKNLPDAFLRRCAFFHIPFPDEELLFEIVQMHFPAKSKTAQKAAIKYFDRLREVATRKKPATAELISWLHVLEVEKFFEHFKNFEQLNDKQKRALQYSLSVLVKTKDDLLAVQKFIEKA